MYVYRENKYLEENNIVVFSFRERILPIIFFRAAVHSITFKKRHNGNETDIVLRPPGGTG
jgi:hypothetical protein